ncbi:MAG TPA: response regulator [Cytophagaceae bacterium]|jgi:response regulator of citrate/malate metabolism|nr:response regulator [Cytophagaceae bacterium]
MTKPFILLIDDDPMSNIFNTMKIKKIYPTIDVFSVTSAIEAIHYLKDKNKRIPSIIFLDLNMPIMNGWDFLEEYKIMNIGIDVILVTSSENAEDISKSKEYKEVKDYIIKPMTTENLQKIVEQNN